MPDSPWIYVALALALAVLGAIHTGRVVRPKWKLWGKLARYLLISTLLAFWLGAWSLIYILGDVAVSLAFHSWVCVRHGLNWWTLAPEEKYIALTEKWARGDFS